MRDVCGTLTIAYSANPALYAARALESPAKIVSGERGRLTGREQGAAQIIDTLVSRKNGGLLAP